MKRQIAKAGLATGLALLTVGCTEANIEKVQNNQCDNVVIDDAQTATFGQHEPRSRSSTQQLFMTLQKSSTKIEYNADHNKTSFFIPIGAVACGAVAG